MANLYLEKKNYTPKNSKHMSTPPANEFSLTSVMRNAANKLEEGNRTRWFTNQLADRVHTIETAVSQFVFGAPTASKRSRVIRSSLVLGGAVILVGAGVYFGRRYINQMNESMGDAENPSKENRKN